MTEYIAPRVFTIEPGQPFLKTLVSSLCGGSLVPGFKFDGEPHCLASSTIYVPTQRSARELRSAFLDELGAQSVLLPMIRTLGEFDEDAAMFEAAADDFIRTPAPIDGLQRQLILGELISRWTSHLKSHLQHYFQDESFTTPVSTSDAFWMARDLAALLDQLQTEDLTFDAIQAAAEAETSDWWQITLSFLQIIKSEWPKILDERQRLDPAAHRNAMLRGEAARLSALQPKSPVIVAGSTGTIPATADLISVVARLPSGAVVLPGYDLSLSPTTKAALEEPDDMASAIGHPQFGMHNLVNKIGAAGLVQSFGPSIGEILSARRFWVAAALEPASETDRWGSLRKQISDQAFDGVSIAVSANEREEAATIAVALREAIADPKVNTALVTPDRMLARRVVTELAKFGILADDSGGTPFDATAHGALVAFTFKVAFDHAKQPAALLALLKNRLVTLGCDPSEHREATRWLELIVMRGGVDRIDLENFHTFAQQQIDALERRRYKPAWHATLEEESIDAALSLAKRIEEAFAPLTTLVNRSGEASLTQAIETTIRSLELLCADDKGDHSALYEGEAGTTLRGLLTQFLASDTDLLFEPAQWPEIFRAASAGLMIKPQSGGHPRIAIWGALEARLQTVDFMILGGLNEGVWPQQTANDAFLTRGMKARMDMQPPERRVGLAAHDFQMAMGQKRVLITRSARLDNAPSVASRWVQRLETLAGEEATWQMREAGQRFVKIAQELQKVPPEKSAARPNPTPPIASRPTQFSVTEIERLRRDPYAIYVKKILGIYPLEPLIRDPDAATRGTLFHKILEEATHAKIDYHADDCVERQGEIVDRVFSDEALPPEIELVWKARFEAAIPELLKWEADRQSLGVERFAEPESKRVAIDQTGVSLKGRADRLDKHADGVVDIIDFKTGGVPSAKQVKSLLAPQMPLEAALVLRDGFDGLRTSQIGALSYIKIEGAGDVKNSDVRGPKTDFVDANELAEKAWEKLTHMMAFYGQYQNGYISRAVPKLEHDYSDEYDHLARVMEWSAGVDANGDET